MATITLSCVICTEFYKNSDAIVSTNCGHVFHNHCLEEWRLRSTQCPTCRVSGITIHRLFLNFEENSSERYKQIVELETKLEQHIKESSLLQEQLDQSERDFFQLEEQFGKKDNEIKEFHKKLDYFTLQNETRTHEIELKTIEIHKLQAALNSTNPQEVTFMLQEEIKILKEKNKQTLKELNKEIRNSTQLAAEKKKLEIMLEHAKSVLPLHQTGKNQVNRITIAEQRKAKGADNSQSGVERPNRGYPQSVVIKNVKGTFKDEDELKNYVFQLSDIMDLFYSGDDLQQVTIQNLSGPGCKSDTMNLIVRFRNVSLKARFLSRKDSLRLHVNTNSLLVQAHVDDKTNSLLNYANELRTYGYKDVFTRNDIVLVRKCYGAVPKRIQNRADVDKLKSEGTLSMINRRQRSMLYQ